MVSPSANKSNSSVLDCAIESYFAGAYLSLTSVILVDLLGLEKLTNAFELILFFQRIACLMGPPIIGNEMIVYQQRWSLGVTEYIRIYYSMNETSLTGCLYDITNSYNPGFH